MCLKDGEEGVSEGWGGGIVFFKIHDILGMQIHLFFYDIII